MRLWLLVVILAVSLLGISQILAADGRSLIRASLQPAAFYLDGEQTASVPAVIEYQGTAYVPLPTIGETLHKQTGWDGKQRIIWLGAKPDATAAKTSVPAAIEKKTALPSAASAQAEPAMSLFGITLGMTEEQVRQTLGQPARREPSPLGFEWWIYNQHLDRYLQVGLRAGKVVDLYSNAPLARIGNVSIGTSYPSLLGKQAIKHVVSFAYQGANIQITNQENVRPLVMNGEIPLIFYLDTQNQQKVTALRMMDKLTLLQGGYYETKWTYQGEAPNFDPAPLSIKQRELVDAAHERQLLDLVNVVRYRYKLPLLSWYHPASMVARSHSRDMENGGYFSHVSATTGLDPFQRLQHAGIPFQMAGENIAAGFPDAIEAHENWMNSPGHRKNVLEKSFAQLGPGVYADYYTQDFLTLQK
jgi:uncharacterized protein YkwD